jgi:hypothetical protein
MSDARCDELIGVGLYHDAKPSQVNDATDYSPWKLRLQGETPDVRPLNAPYQKVGIRGYHFQRVIDPAWSRSSEYAGNGAPEIPRSPLRR